MIILRKKYCCGKFRLLAIGGRRMDTRCFMLISQPRRVLILSGRTKQSVLPAQAKYWFSVYGTFRCWGSEKFGFNFIPCGSQTILCGAISFEARTVAYLCSDLACVWLYCAGRAKGREGICHLPRSVLRASVYDVCFELPGAGGTRDIVGVPPPTSVVVRLSTGQLFVSLLNV